MDKKFYLLFGGIIVVLFFFTKRAWRGHLPSSMMQWDRYIRKNAETFNIPAALIAAVIEIESQGKATSVGAGNEIGLMQLMLPTAQQMGYTGRREALFNVQLNIYYGAKYLRWQWDRYGGNIEKVFSAYNAGTATTINEGYVRKGLRAFAKYSEHYGGR